MLIACSIASDAPLLLLPPPCCRVHCSPQETPSRIHCCCQYPPLFKVQSEGETWEVKPGPDNAFHAMVLILAINKLCVVRGARSDAALKFPDHGVTYRGGALPDEHQAFFTAGKKYRVPGFLATSFNESSELSLVRRSFLDSKCSQRRSVKQRSASVLAAIIPT